MNMNGLTIIIIIVIIIIIIMIITVIGEYLDKQKVWTYSDLNISDVYNICLFYNIFDSKTLEYVCSKLVD